MVPGPDFKLNLVPGSTSDSGRGGGTRGRTGEPTGAARPSRRRPAGHPFELFFDLVFVFAVTQLSHTLLDHVITGGAAQTLMLDQVGSDGRA